MAFWLQEPLHSFLLEKKMLPLAGYFSSIEWVSKRAYLCNTLYLLNEFNLPLEGTTSVSKLAYKMAAFKANLQVWGQQVKTLAGILEETESGTSFSHLLHETVPDFKKV